jgi:hypothetical protein
MLARQVGAMQILLTDETNRQPSREAKFFVYGGLVLTVEALSTLHAEIEEIRRTAGYHAGDELKFDTHARPAHVTVEEATEAKRQVIDCAKRAGCIFIVHVILHNIITNQDADQQVQWAADYVIGRFNQYLTYINDDGICIVDNLPNRAEFRYLSQKFAHGLTLATGTHITLDRIKLFASTCVGASHVNSVMDIVLGSFRYCINNPQNPDAAREMLGSVASMMWGRRVGEDLQVRGRGLILRPEISDIHFEPYRHEYEALIEHLGNLLHEERGAG